MTANSIAQVPSQPVAAAGFVILGLDESTAMIYFLQSRDERLPVALSV